MLHPINIILKDNKETLKLIQKSKGILKPKVILKPNSNYFMNLLRIIDITWPSAPKFKINKTINSTFIKSANTSIVNFSYTGNDIQDVLFNVSLAGIIYYMTKTTKFKGIHLVLAFCILKELRLLSFAKKLLIDVILVGLICSAKILWWFYKSRSLTLFTIRSKKNDYNDLLKLEEEIKEIAGKLILRREQEFEKYTNIYLGFRSNAIHQVVLGKKLLTPVDSNCSIIRERFVSWDELEEKIQRDLQWQNFVNKSLQENIIVPQNTFIIQFTKQDLMKLGTPL